jgi:Gas vesicle synthesis protein GvpL/GvpF
VAEWVYGVTEGISPTLAGESGIDGAAVRLVRAGTLAALVSAVDFDEDALKESLEDLERLEELARSHQEVVDRALTRGAVVPFRLCTMFEDDARVREMLEQERSRLEATLDRLRGAAEWGVKAYRERLTQTAQTPTAGSGTEWLQRKRDDRAAAEAAQTATDEHIASIHTQLAEHARAAALARPHDRRLSGDEREMLLNGAYLVPLDRAEGFRAVVDELGHRHASHGLRLELTGPWAPYHFVAR